MAKKAGWIWTIAVALGLSVFGGSTMAREIQEENCFFLRSLHYTAKGMGYWYSKQNGGLEVVTGVPYEKLGCKNCHIAGCDRCHKAEKTDRDCKVNFYSAKAGKNQAMCLECHAREKAMIGIDHKAKQEDVHIVQGMVCNDCHSAREMHGDGIEYDSMRQPHAMDTRCEKCHDSVKPTEAHTVHEGKLDCKACHVRHVVSCANCHFDTMVQTGKRTAVPVWGWVFLMNHAGKVTSASMQTFVAKGNKTFLMFAPHMSHSIMKEGRTCDGCHATETMKKASQGKLELLWMQDGKVVNLKGAIPVSDAVEYQCTYLDRQNDQWVPIKGPEKPVRQYVAFGKPLTKEQLEKLAKKQEAPPPKMR